MMDQGEGQRAKAIQRFLNLKVSRENELQGIVEMAAQICQTQVAIITFADKTTQIVKYNVGINIKHVKRAGSFCEELIAQRKSITIADITETKFADNKFVKSIGARFYAGTPIITFDGLIVGTLCVFDDKPGSLTGKQIEMLELLARQVITMVEFDMSIDVLKAQYHQVKESENKLRSFFDSSVSCHFLLDRDMRITAFNKTAAKFVKTALNVKLKAGIIMTDHVENVERFSKNFYKALSGKIVKAEIEVMYKDGPIWWGIICEPAYDIDGQIIGVSYNATDITDAKRNQQKVSEQNQKLRNIAFVQSHELRKPVASILGLMYLIKLNNYVADEEHFDMLESATLELDQKIHSIITEIGMD